LFEKAVEQTRATEELVNRPLVKSWLWWALVWLTIFPLVGMLVSIKFHNPGFLGRTSWLTFGRLLPVHVNGVIFGAFSRNSFQASIRSLSWKVHPSFISWR
jgi:cbb3-type cytochrome oxidase subunit 1